MNERFVVILKMLKDCKGNQSIKYTTLYGALFVRCI